MNHHIPLILYLTIIGTPSLPRYSANLLSNLAEREELDDLIGKRIAVVAKQVVQVGTVGKRAFFWEVNSELIFVTATDKPRQDQIQVICLMRDGVLIPFKVGKPLKLTGRVRGPAPVSGVVIIEDCVSVNP